MEKLENITKLVNDCHVGSEIGNVICPSNIKFILKNALNLPLSYDKKIEYLNSLIISLTNDEIKDYLMIKEMEVYRNIDERKENQRIMNSYFSSLDKNDELYQIFQNPNKMNILYYYFEPSILNNYIKYASKLKTNIINILDLIYELENSYIDNTIQDKKYELLNKNIRIYEDGFIHCEDIVKLIITLDTYITELKEVVEKANNLDTYLNFPIYDKLLYKFGVMTYESQQNIKRKTKVPNK